MQTIPLLLDGGYSIRTLLAALRPGVPRLWLFDRPFEIIQKPEQIVISYEEDHNFRQV